MKSTQRVKIETPIGSIESDSGSHFIDVLTVLLVIVVIYFLRKLIK
tara:strand:+ start:36186 stop:36323 length:138 start_codon:yes stop_codon:yes gene_type:complete